jgi:dTDP-4-amino-4,6-dideoxygalactose transaminase
VFADCEVFGGDISAQLFENGLCIPSGSSLTDSQRDQVVGGIRAVFGRP